MIDKEPMGEEPITPKDNPEELESISIPDETDEIGAEPSSEETGDGTEISKDSDEACESSTDIAEAVRKADRESSFTLLAAILSGASLAVLCLLMLFITLGTILNDQKLIVQLQVSGSNAQTSYADDSEMLEDFLNSVVEISAEKATSSGGGTGIIVSENGYIVTNYHVVKNASSIYVRLYGDSDNIEAKLVGFSADDDIAVIKIEKAGLRPATFVRDCAECRLGERVYAVGAPESSDYSWTVTQGIISYVNREVKIYDESGKELEKKMRVIQTDAPVNHGNSGGPLINRRGEVVGIVSIKLESYIQKNGELKVLDGLGFALPSDGVLPLIEAIIETGSAKDVDSTITSGRPLTGIEAYCDVEEGKWYEITEGKAKTVDEKYAKAHPDATFFASEEGICVISVGNGSDADGKLLPQDVITAIDGKRIYNSRQLSTFINDLHGGDEIEITYLRDGKTATVTVTVTEAPVK